ncbi:hypothetical protein [Bradyrhizobium sp. LHD-71]|uniref:hypothetical protein n=1 Tax=Bradyrhizobium sp. LHD-71 TaxID=3072141 RepID=UPI00280EF291|nr:hypothetical protein [Bradyrhizobium sp. LHD-71]MDQ8730937.1 hypothetical protein [Bradyrhizobium sp. LHD-71]
MPGKNVSMFKVRLAIAIVAVSSCVAAVAQDVPGIEICTAEKSMDRRTSCLQSNINFLQQSLTKQGLAAQQKLDAARSEVEALKTQLSAMRKEIDDLKKKDQNGQKEPAKK